MAWLHALYRYFKIARDRIEKSCLGLSVVGDGFSFALRVGLFGGFLANLIDVDHVLMLYGGPDRVLHKTLFVLALLVAVHCCARLGRLFAWVVLVWLKRRKKLAGDRPPSA